MLTRDPFDRSGPPPGCLGALLRLFRPRRRPPASISLDVGLPAIARATARARAELVEAHTLADALLEDGRPA